MTAKRIHIIGRKNSGKTTLIVDLVRHLTSQGYRIGTMKHTHHDHELDTPGKDSHRHRESGSAVVGILSRKMTAVFQPTEHDDSSNDDRYASLMPMFSDCHLVLVEGDSMTTATRIEVWRDSSKQRPIAVDDLSIHAIITEDDVDVGIPIWKRASVEASGENLLGLAELS